MVRYLYRKWIACWSKCNALFQYLDVGGSLAFRVDVMDWFYCFDASGIEIEMTLYF
jgi:hypothetical protein